MNVPTAHSALLESSGGASAVALFSFESHLTRAGLVEVTGTSGTFALPDRNAAVHGRPGGLAVVVAGGGAGVHAGVVSAVSSLPSLSYVAWMRKLGEESCSASSGAYGSVT